MAKLLRLQDHPYTTVYELFVKQLKNDPVLKRVVKSWITYTDLGGEVPGTVEASATLPSVQVMTLAEPGIALTQTRQDVPLGLVVVLTTDGQDLRDNLNLWGAVCDAVFKGDGQALLSRAVQAAVAGRADFVSFRIAVPALTPLGDPRDTSTVQAKGVLIADMTVRK